MLLKGKGKNVNVLFKDWEKINHYNDVQYEQNFKELETKLEEARQKGYENVFLDEKFITDKIKKANHQECEMKQNPTSTVTEKRICRCMKYYGTNSFCNSCPLNDKYHNVSTEYVIFDAEMPTHKVIKSCGGIDLVITKKNNSRAKFAVEVKPPKSKETLVRMIAEIYTYTAEPEFKKYKKAIGFFKDSKQHKDYEKYKNTTYFKNVTRNIAIFMFETLPKKNGVIDFVIERIK